MRDILEKLAAGHAGFAVKGKKTPYCALNGNMFAFVDDGGQLCLRFSETRKAAFNEEHGQGDVIQYGSVMRGYVRIPQRIVSDASALEALFSEAVEHARSLKPKPTKRGG